MDNKKSVLLNNWDYIEKEYSIPDFNAAAMLAGSAIVGAAAVAGLPIVGAGLVGLAIGASTAAKKKKINKDEIPDDLFKNECSTFYKMICQYCDERGITESELYNKAKVSRAVFSNIRSMSIKSYIPSKDTIMKLCIALRLELIQAQSLLHIIGYSLSNNIITDKFVSFCLEHPEYEYDVDSINDMIYEKTNNESYLLKA